MKPLNTTFTAVTFSEVPDYTGNIHNDFVVSVDDPFNQDQYSNSLFNKILTIGLSEFSDFLDFNCDKIKKPNEWLNSLEKLIKLNFDHFNTSQLKHRHTKLISQIDIKRHSLKQTIRLDRKKLNGFSDEKEYSFTQVKEHLAALQTSIEKIAYLEDQIIDYRQNPPDFISRREEPFDKQCELEIERIEKQEVVNQKLIQKSNSQNKGRKMLFNGDVQTLSYLFYQLTTIPFLNGEFFFPWNQSQTADFICNNFCNPDGSFINRETVRTNLSSSKPEKTPKIGKRIIVSFE